MTRILRQTRIDKQCVISCLWRHNVPRGQSIQEDFTSSKRKKVLYLSYLRVRCENALVNLSPSYTEMRMQIDSRSNRWLERSPSNGNAPQNPRWDPIGEQHAGRAPPQGATTCSITTVNRPAEWVVNIARAGSSPSPLDATPKRYGYETVPRSPSGTHTARRDAI